MKIRQSTREFHVSLQANFQPTTTARNLGVIARSIAGDLHIKPRAEVAMGELPLPRDHFGGRFDSRSELLSSDFGVQARRDAVKLIG